MGQGGRDGDGRVGWAMGREGNGPARTPLWVSRLVQRNEQGAL